MKLDVAPTGAEQQILTQRGRSTSSPSSTRASAAAAASCSPPGTRGRPTCEGGATLDFLAETRELREGDWQVAAPPPDYLDRRVEITGPTDRKLVINALNSGARGFMADFEDANSPTWANQVEGHVNLIDAIEGTIEYDSSEGKEYRLDDEIATLLVRPRGWHLPEKHLVIDGRARRRARSSTSACTCSTAAAGSPSRGAASSSTCRSSSTTSRRGSGTTSSASPRTSSGWRAAPCARPS